jgi:hypothetical protein
LAPSASRAALIRWRAQLRRIPAQLRARRLKLLQQGVAGAAGLDVAFDIGSGECVDLAVEVGLQTQ